MASMLGDECGKIPAICELLMSIRGEALIRLKATASALQLRQPWVLRLPGGFNEQALSNIVYAFDRAQLLDRDLLQVRAFSMRQAPPVLLFIHLAYRTLLLHLLHSILFLCIYL